jgi:4a-hydroxytetrahydrobiopterin dehydratase
MSKRPKLLSSKDIDKRLQAISDWQVNKQGTELAKTFEMKNFVAGLAFVAKVAVYAEIMEHHPDIELSYGKVKVKLSTHDPKGLTKLDFELAKKIDGVKIG